MRCIELLIALSSALAAWSTDVGTPSRAEAPPEASADAIRFEHGSLLGLQRSVQLSRARAPLEDDKVKTASGGLRGTEQPQHSRDTSVKSVVPEAGISLAMGSLLGLQRSAKVTRGSALPVEEDAATPERTRLEQGEHLKAETHSDPGLKKTSAGLGLQRSTTLRSRQAPPREEKREDLTSKDVGSKSKLTAELDDDLADLRFEDVSVLGLQRSVKVERRSGKSSAPRPAQASADSLLEV
mmetsp:Transcript_95444/g.165768  ORF Transcript_95444/g.165768 Transcript_95444/m.165768 type:complete len:240 (+) Transcript_95444:98-817(+)